MPKLVAVLLLSSFAVTAAYANNWRASSHVGWSSPPAAAPEIDPTNAVAGITLLFGGLAILRARRLKK